VPDSSPDAPEWSPADKVETRRFKCEIEQAAEGGPGEGGPRLQLLTSADGRSLLMFRVPAPHLVAVRKELVERGYRGSLPVMVRGRADYGSWMGYLHELEVAHIVVENLGWTLNAEEQAALDAADDYGRRAPRGFRSPRLRQP
jgi:hypothetical protein